MGLQFSYSLINVLYAADYWIIELMLELVGTLAVAFFSPLLEATLAVD